jgi:hypothetical protein
MSDGDKTKMNEILKGFGNLHRVREQEEALDLFNALKEGKLTTLAENCFDRSSCDVYFNPNSGYVFLADEDYNTVMIDDEGELDLFINTPYNGCEGFFDDLMNEYEEMNNEDKEYMQSMATDEHKEKYKVLN